jgi:predicted HTH domain antitoxin
MKLSDVMIWLADHAEDIIIMPRATPLLELPHDHFNALLQKARAALHFDKQRKESAIVANRSSL